jgi:uncharacterized membrane protein YhaH (DUF805 family)
VNPLSNTLSRTDFLKWNMIALVVLIGFGISIDATKANHVGLYWLSYRIAFCLIWGGITLLILIRRLQNAGLSSWLLLCFLIPFVGVILWFVLFFIPTKKHST